MFCLSPYAFPSVSVPTGGDPTFSGLAFEDADLSTGGGWTLYDPDGVVKSVTHSGGFNTVTFNALTGTSDYNWASGAAHRAPRWYKLLTISSSQMTEADRVGLFMRYENDDTVNDFNQRIVFGSCTAPTSTVPATIDGAGGAFARSVSGTTAQQRPSYGCWTIAGESSNTTTNQAYSVVAHYRGNSGLGTPVCYSLDTSNAIRHVTSRNSNTNNLGTANIFLIVGAGIRANTNSIAQDDQVKFKVGFREISMEAGA